MCCALWLSTPVRPKGVLEYPWSTPSTQGEHMQWATTRVGDIPQCDLGRDLVAY
jgi:hypothetical protein